MRTATKAGRPAARGAARASRPAAKAPQATVGPVTPAGQPHWAEVVHPMLIEAGVRQVALVPDAGHARLIQLCEADSRMRIVRLTTEEEGVGLLAGAWLGGEKGVLLMQSSGAGNCINMLSLPVAAAMPLLMLVTMRGDHGEFNGAQVPMGDSTQAVLEAVGVLVKRADIAADVPEMISSGLRLAFNTLRPVAVLIGQRVSGAKDFRKLTKPVEEDNE
ncbi:MAG TPA: phosphonopyruvate decarboxylase [Burkholderiales bacterium]|jgi:sulfopyruvate decarboxylase alpha subunit